MKKFLFFSLAMGFGLLTYAQNKSVMQDLHIIKPVGLQVANDQFIGTAKPPILANSQNKAVDGIYLGTSFNIFGSLTSEQNCLSVNTATNTIGFFHRSGGGWDAANNRDLRLKFSSDNGTTWDSLQIAGSTTNRFRYPGGALYNKTGNTDPKHLYAIYSGPITNGTGFSLNAEGSSRLDSTEVHTCWAPYGPANTYLNHLNERMQVCDNKWVHVSSTHYQTAGTSGTFDYFQVVNGQFNETLDSVVWGTPVNITPPLLSLGGFFGQGMAFSKDGSIGYFYVIAKDSNNANNSAMPILWTSTDNGATWAGPVYFDFGTIATLTDFCWPLKNDPATVIPFFCAGDNTSGAEVDQNNKLHIFCTVKGLSTQWMPDSIGYTFTYENPHIVDVYQDGTSWNVRFIDNLFTKSVASADPQALASSGGNPIGWDHRIQASKTEDGSKLFCLWVDQPDSTITTPEYNVSLPDLFGQGYDIPSSTPTPTQNFTEFTAFSYEAFFNYIGDRTLISGTDYIVPATITIPVNQSADDVPSHYFLKGVIFKWSGIGEISSEIPSCSLYPNPAKDHVDVEMTLNSNNKVQVVIHDILGQQVYNRNCGILSKGQQRLSISTKNFSSGIYLISIKAGDQKVTRKLIVE